jgi:hypothetical protein
MSQIAALRPKAGYYAAKAAEDGIVALMTLAALQFPYVAVGCGLLLAVPWCGVAWLGRRLGRTDALYFAASGALSALLVIGTVLVALLPRDGMTVVGHFALVVFRDGPALLPFGGMCGLTYWRIAIAPGRPERRGSAARPA